MVFSNKFNSKKADPLVEAAKSAMELGQKRREAINAVNEEFGVYNRNAVVREQLAAYDARIEEVFNGMKSGNLTEGKKLADKDYDHDGKIESPKDEVWGSRLRAAKAAGNLEEGNRENKEKKKGHEEKTGMEHIKKMGGFPGQSLKRTARELNKEETDYSAQDRAPVTKSAPKEDPSTPKSYPGAASSLTAGNPTSQRMSNAVKPKLQESVSRKHFQQVADLIKGHESQEKRNELATHHAGIFAKQNPRFNHEKFHAAAGSTAHQQKKVDEAAYSAKAARAGKDIGKPGKMFSKIAAKSGGGEKGERIAGAILKKIRAKHMKEEQSF
jgi:hypothetical protein